MNVQHDIIICTTAVDRPELHKNTFTKYLEFLDGCNFHWMIHLNNVWSNYVHSMNMCLCETRFAYT